MIPARYSLIRYIPDAARGEQLNVGILGWTDTYVIVDVDDKAIERVVRENPHLAKDALVGLKDQLTDELLQAGAGGAAEWLLKQPPVACSLPSTDQRPEVRGNHFWGFMAYARRSRRRLLRTPVWRQGWSNLHMFMQTCGEA